VFETLSADSRSSARWKAGGKHRSDLCAIVCLVLPSFGTIESQEEDTSSRRSLSSPLARIRLPKRLLAKTVFVPFRTHLIATIEPILQIFGDPFVRLDYRMSVRAQSEMEFL
jgi:hypothetical protein